MNKPRIKVSPVIKTLKLCNFRRNLKNVVLAVNFNFPVYDVIPLLRKFYGKDGELFGKIVFCGDRKSNLDNIITVEENGGYQSYTCLAEAIKHYPGYDGYIFSNDDVLLNWWNLNDDMKSIWSGAEKKPTNFHRPGERHKKHSWHWWSDSTQTATRCEKAFNRVVSMKHNVTGKLLETFYRNTKNASIVCVAGRSDFVYIPKHLAANFLLLSKVYQQEKVFLEVAIPTILAFLDDFERHVYLKTMYYVDLYGYSKEYLNGAAFYATYSFDLAFSHPFKLAKSKVNQKFFHDTIIPFGENRARECLKNN